MFVYLGKNCHVESEAFKDCNKIKYFVIDYDDKFYYYHYSLKNFGGKYVFNNVSNYTELCQKLRYRLNKAYVNGLSHEINDDESNLRLLPVPVSFKNGNCKPIEATLLYERDFSRYHFELLYLLAQT